MAKIVKLIYTEQRKGLGQSTLDPVRFVQQWYDKKGNLIFEKDPIEEDRLEVENEKPKS